MRLLSKDLNVALGLVASQLMSQIGSWMMTDLELEWVEREVAGRLLVELPEPFGLQESPISAGDQIHWTRFRRALSNKSCQKHIGVL